MLSDRKLNELCRRQALTAEGLAKRIIRGGQKLEQVVSAVKNWRKGLLKPLPRRRDVAQLATALGVEPSELTVWQSSYQFAPISPRKVQLVTQLIAGRPVQEALDVLKFTRKRAAPMVSKVLKSAIADASEAQADVESLYVSEARVDGAGIRVGTKRWRAKDRGRTHSIHKMASHIRITVAQV
jgi:large subunit ribosomal protein L22